MLVHILIGPLPTAVLHTGDLDLARDLAARIDSTIGLASAVHVPLCTAIVDSQTSFNAPVALVPRVLVADDDPDMLDLVASLLRRDGFLVVEATNGAELLDLVTVGSEANLMITDVQMPGISGLEVLSHMQSRHPRVPVILMTAFSSDHLREQARKNGAAAVLDKPFSVAALRELVVRHVRKD